MENKTPTSTQNPTAEIKIGNTTYIVTNHFAPNGITVSEKIKRLLDRDTRQTL